MSVFTLVPCSVQTICVVSNQVNLGDRGVAQLKFKPLLSPGSDIVQVTYPIPFGLNAEPKVSINSESMKVSRIQINYICRINKKTEFEDERAF